MPDTGFSEDGRELLYLVEGERAPRSMRAPARVTAAELIVLVAHETGRGDLELVLIEDYEFALEGHHVVFERITIEDFKLPHIASRGAIEVTVGFNGQNRAASFGPNATMAKIVDWSVREFGLEGGNADFQLKHDGEVLPPGDHLGQVAHRQKSVALALVMKIKPQGSAG